MGKLQVYTRKKKASFLMYVLSQACAMKLNKVFVELQPFVLVGIFHC